MITVNGQPAVFLPICRDSYLCNLHIESVRGYHRLIRMSEHPWRVRYALNVARFAWKQIQERAGNPNLGAIS